MIIRDKDRETFTVISNQAINDTQISDKALGTLVRLLSKPDNWSLNINHMVKTGKQGRTAIRSSIAELEKAGYIHRDVVRDQAGRITGTEYLVYEQAVCGGQGSKLSRETASPLPGDSQAKTPTKAKTQSSETCNKETAPIINTDIKQILRETTTTTPGQADEQPPVIESPPVEPSSSYPATKDINFLLDLIPEQHKQPMVISLVNQSAKKYTALELEEAIVHASDNVRGGWMQYKAFLDKSLKGKWAAGYLETIETQTTAPAVLSPGGFAGGIPAGKYPNGTVTGCARMDSNYMAAAAFLNRRRANHDQ